MDKTKLPRKVKTIQDVLARDDMNDFLTELEAKKSEIVHAIIIYEDKDGTRFHRVTNDLPLSYAVGILELAKQDLYKEAYSEDNDD